MKITEIESFAISIPMEDPATGGRLVHKDRDHAIVYVRTDEGVEGMGYTLGYNGSTLIADAVSTLLEPLVVDEDPRDTEKLWRRMFDGTSQIGRKGLLLRAISIVDIALWDIKAKDAGQPLYKFLGAYTDEVPAYASGGYYREERGTESLRDEMQRYVDSGHDIVKMKVGMLSEEEEEERVRVARETIGDERTLLLDAVTNWTSKQEAVRMCRRFEPYDPYFVEEPVKPDSIDLMREIHRAIDIPLATGEVEYTRYGFRDLIREKAVDIIQADATVVGGITEWLKVANSAATLDIPVTPHYNWDLHVQLVAAIENGQWVEYFYRDTGLKLFDDVLAHTLQPDGSGKIRLPDRDGHGVVLDEDRVAEFRIES